MHPAYPLGRTTCSILLSVSAVLIVNIMRSPLAAAITPRLSSVQSVSYYSTSQLGQDKVVNRVCTRSDRQLLLAIGVT